MKQTLVITLLTLSFAAVTASAQSTADKAPSQASQTHGYWTDPATNLMWTTKDNGKDVSWKNAIKYCRKLSVAGYTDWRMPNMDELQGIYDKNANSPGLMGAEMYHNVAPATWHIKGNIFLTGDQWSTLQRLDDRSKPSGYVYYFDFNDGKPDNEPTGWPYPYVGRRVLCVHGPQAFPPLVKP